VIRYSNSIKSEPSYDDVLRVGAELLNACRDNKTFILKVNQSREPETRVTQLNINLIDLSIRLFLLILHRPFAAKGMKDPHFYFSRKVCLESAFAMLNYPSLECPGTNQNADSMILDDYAQLKIVSGDFKGAIIYTSMIIFHELDTQLEEEGSAFTHETKASTESLKQCLQDILHLSADRITMGENNILIHLLVSVVLAHIEAMEEGVNPEPVVLESAKNSSLLCYDLMSARITGINGSLPTDTDSSGVLDYFGDSLAFGMDFAMQDLGNQDIQESWLQFGC
jgi:hypothetical protein